MRLLDTKEQSYRGYSRQLINKQIVGMTINDRTARRAEKIDTLNPRVKMYQERKGVSGNVFSVLRTVPGNLEKTANVNICKACIRALPHVSFLLALVAGLVLVRVADRDRRGVDRRSRSSQAVPITFNTLAASRIGIHGPGSLGHVVRASAAVALYGGDHGRVERTARRRGARGKSTTTRGGRTITCNMTKATTIL
ncbi:uncharacterized protein LAESUDRAFT_222449 [Laetiporus sulphureus 93-53]|uniref:Uncharacterized protein n=1 Tax=Laetiporus sulphureus 93-53 TaxID=1314785 RepID=A0A165DTJ8_9APHY|nr:uncharacterized protein LAESUDRAFT_222449 [Laetiporus sulphureus 93-53]KZT05604.1 hypothetical protein LAESUDRAFT_222449 [Laetiporus sulphureus 93-53]